VVVGAIVAGGITNTGTINSTIAIDFTELGAPQPPPGAPITINQNAGAIMGAILLSNNADVLNLNGGTITGVVTGGGATTFNIVGGAFNVADQAANSVGTFKMTGGTINFGVTPNTAQHATITSQNAATVGGTFNVVEAGPPGSYAKTQTYTNVFIAPATAGTFNVTSASALFNASLVPGTAGGDLSLVLNFGLTGNTPNESATASGLNPLLFAPANPSAAALHNAFNSLNSAQGPAALDLFSGEIHASVQTVLLDDSQFMRNAILGRLRQAAYAGAGGDIGALGFAGPVEVAEAETSSTAQQDAQAYAGAAKAKRAAGAYAGVFPVKAKPPAAAPPDLTFWSQGIGAWGRIDGDGNAAGLTDTFGGFLSGVDTRLGTWRVGAAAGYSQTSIKDGARASSASVSTAHFGAYAATDLGPLNVRTGAASAFSTVETSRIIALPAFFDHDTARHEAKTAQVFGEVGQAMALGRLAVEPFAGLAYVWLNNDGFSETGGLAALTGAGNVDNLGYSTLGLRLATLYALPNGTTLVPRATLAWQHAFGTPPRRRRFPSRPAARRSPLPPCRSRATARSSKAASTCASPRAPSSASHIRASSPPAHKATPSKAPTPGVSERPLARGPLDTARRALPLPGGERVGVRGLPRWMEARFTLAEQQRFCRARSRLDAARQQRSGSPHPTLSPVGRGSEVPCPHNIERQRDRFAASAEPRCQPAPQAGRNAVRNAARSSGSSRRR
jgi:outer membrane autotransporter protein